MARRFVGANAGGFRAPGPGEGPFRGASRLPKEVQAFLDWFNAPAEVDPVLAAGLANLRFVTIHPFDDGNGRIARAITDMALARAEGSPQRFYSMSSQIRNERAEYYRILESAQRRGVNVTPWLRWFVDCMGRAIAGSESALATVFSRARFWEQHSEQEFNARQRRMLKLLLEGLEGRLTSSRWARINHCSQDTAQRDIAALVELGLLVRSREGGRSTSYRLVNDSPQEGVSG